MEGLELLTRVGFLGTAFGRGVICSSVTHIAVRSEGAPDVLLMGLVDCA